MVRTQIQLTENQARKIRRIAAQQNISVAEVIRRCIDQELNRAPSLADKYEHARNIIGIARDRYGKIDVAKNHDRYLEDAFR